MSGKKIVKTSHDVEVLEKINKSKLFTFKFDNFEVKAEKNERLGFSNYYKSQEHFLKVNSDLVESLKIISNESFDNAIVRSNLRNMHFKLLEKPESIERIKQILSDIFNKNQNFINQLNEGSSFLEFGLERGSRFIAILIDYHIIDMLYIDSNHLTFGNKKFDIKSKLNYTIQPLYNMNSSSTYEIDFFSKDKVLEKISEDKMKESIDFILYILDEIKDNKLSDEEIVDTIKSIAEEN